MKPSSRTRRGRLAILLCVALAAATLLVLDRAGWDPVAAKDSLHRIYRKGRLAARKVEPVCFGVRDYPLYSPYDPRISLFGSPEGALRWIRERGLDPARLRLRNRPFSPADGRMPDGLYALDDQLILIDRKAGIAFRPPPRLRAPAEVRAAARAAVWADGDPFDHPGKFPVSFEEIVPPDVGKVTRHKEARSWRIRYHRDLSSRITWFSPAHPEGDRYLVYHRGHGGAAVALGGRTIDRFLDRGWQVIAMEMPLNGRNLADAGTRYSRGHNDFHRLDDGRSHPIGLFLLPVKAVVDRIVERSPGGAGAGDRRIMLMGVSGGGWTSYFYGAVDPRVDYVVSIAGGTPVSLRLANGPLELGDYEQFDPAVYDRVAHEELMLAAGSRGGLYIYNEHDSACYQLSEGDPFLKFMTSAPADSWGKIMRVFVDRRMLGHDLGTLGEEALDRFLADVGQGAEAPK